MRVVVLSSVFPNSANPLFGIFVKERIARVAQHCEVVIVAPVPWFPFCALLRRRRAERVPDLDVIDGLEVYHPRFFSVPGLCKSLDGFFYFLSVLPLLVRLRSKFRFDLIDAHFIYPDGVGACLAARWFGCPVTITLRGTIGKLAKFRLRRTQIQWALTVASRIFSVSQSLREIALQLGCDPLKTRVIPNGVDSSVFRPVSKKAARAALGLPLDWTILLSVGSLCERKGHHRIIQVLPELIAAHPNLVFVVVGGAAAEGDMGPQLARLTRQLGVDIHVRFVGARPHYEIATWLAAADLFCLATSNEGMANVLVEALSCGIPVVTTRVGGNAELVEDGVNGFLVDFGDHLGLQNALRKALNITWSREAIANTMKGRTWDVTALQLSHEWRALIEETKRGEPQTLLESA